MTRAARIVGIASLLAMSTALTGVAPAGAAGVTATSVAAMTTRAGCARMSDGTARCSGLNETGQLGDGTNTSSLVAVVVHNPANSAALQGVAQVVTGNFFACARLTNGGVDCWGDNSYGQLGNGTTNATALPVAVRNSSGTGPLTGVAQIAAGKYHTCARLTNGGVDCWGNNGYFELGDGSNIQHLLPHPVLNGAGHAPLTNQVNISITQYNSCSVQSDGTARCWGLNQFGMLGDGTTQFRTLPTKVKAVAGSGFLANVSSISTAPNHTCALLKNGTMNCWGLNNFGQLGDGTVITRLRPVVVKNVPGTAPLVHVAQITTGGGSSGDHTCARLIAKTALCWGAGFFGQLGDGTKQDRHRPVVVKAAKGTGALANVTGVTAGPIATCATITGGNVLCWGFNQGGQFGNGTAQNAARPVIARP